MAQFKVKAPDGTEYQVNAPDGATEADAIAYVQKNMHGTNKKSVIGQYVDETKNGALGLLKGATNIGTTLLWPLDATGITGKTHDERKADLNQFYQNNADPNSFTFKGGELSSEIMGTGGVGQGLAKGAVALGLPKLAPVLASGGFDMGGLNLGNRVANGAVRTLAGAATGAGQTALVSPEQTGTGAVIGAITPGAVKASGALVSAVGDKLDSWAFNRMKSALKPSTGADPKEVKLVIETMLSKGINVSNSGAEKLQNMIRSVSQEVDSMVNQSTGTVSKQDVIKALDRSVKKFSVQANPVSDLEALKNVRNEFDNVWPDQIPVPVAHQMKKGTYSAINSRNYGETKGAAIEGQKDLARGLKEGVENLVPGVKSKNQDLQGMMTAADFLNRAAGRETNKDLLGLALLGPSLPQLAGATLDRNALFKSLLARGMHNTSMGINGFSIPNYGLLNAPSMFAISP